ncbi:unnamed protein product [Caenorhabditis sp. 36 PRJEB53466]|nr:unnamed protein product [Caenorhabditis sp. 36 PRJEB53466]
MSTASGAIPQENGAAPVAGNNANGPQEEIDINLDDPQVQDAAKKIQNVFRGKRFGEKKTAPAAEAKQ